jgi:hypothetical protein
MVTLTIPSPSGRSATAFPEFLSHPPLWSGVRFTRETLICSTRMARQVCDCSIVTNLGTAVGARQVLSYEQEGGGIADG